MQCDYFDAGRCRSCTLMGTPYGEQIAAKQEQIELTLQAAAPALRWHSPYASAESGFRNKAKWVIGGSAARPTLGILDDRGRGVDIRGCGVCEPLLQQAFPILADVITRLELTPYDVPNRAGELKYLIVTASPAGELMARFVLRTDDRVADLRAELPRLQRELPQLVVLSANIHPAHKAVVEGDREILLTKQDTLPMVLNDRTLHLRPRSFFQTNTAVAAGLYRQAQAWAEALQPGAVLDLYCGVGGFAVHCAPPSATSITGVELSPEAVESARLTAAELIAPQRFTFVTADATAPIPFPDADLVIVNPPRRGIGAELADRLEASSARTIIYSSCNASSLAVDLAALPTFSAVQARMFDMFPQTRHAEVIVYLQRLSSFRSTSDTRRVPPRRNTPVSSTFN